jgi:hypothetical protein
VETGSSLTVCIPISSSSFLSDFVRVRKKKKQTQKRKKKKKIRYQMEKEKKIYTK